MKRVVFRIAIVVLWLALTGWLIRYEAFPDFFTRSADGYRSIMRRDVLAVDSWMRVLFQDAPVGYTHTSMDVDEANPVAHCTVNNRLYIRLKIMGQAQDINADASFSLDLLNHLQRFEFSLSSRQYTARVKAVRIKDDNFKIVMKTGGGVQEMQARIPDDAVLYSPMTEMAVKNLRPGSELKLRTVDPATLASTVVTIRALRREKITVGGVAYDATALSSEYRGITTTAWIDKAGNMLRQVTPFGWSLERCTAEEAFAAVRKAGEGEDVMAAMAVPCDGRITSPRACTLLRLRLTGVSFAESELQSRRQTVLETEGKEAEIVVTGGVLPATAAEPSPLPADVAVRLAPSPGVQSDHPDIVALAKKITADRSDAIGKTKAILDWVYRNVDKEITVSLPSALDVLKQRKGDCNEHTALFVALARAAGIPAVAKVGLAYADEKFYYHAWPAVYVGQWWELDPTWGQEAVDATHIALAEGDVAEQLQLLKVIGQLRIAVVEAQTSDK